MSHLIYSIDSRIFFLFPEYFRGVVIATGVKNCASPDKLVTLLRQAESDLCQRLTLKSLANEPKLLAWREAFRKIGIKPTDFRPSIEALVRRVLHGQEIPSINALVDIGNLISLRHLLPVGGHAIDQLTDSICLRLADGSEEFVPFGATEIEHPQPGEIIFTEGNIVLTRRWIWRQANTTLTLPETTAIEINLDGLLPIEQSEMKSIANEMMELITRFCGGKMEYRVMDTQQKEIKLP